MIIDTITDITFGSQNDLPTIIVTYGHGSYINLLHFLQENTELITIIHSFRDIIGVVFVVTTIIYIIQSIPSLLDGDLG